MPSTDEFGPEDLTPGNRLRELFDYPEKIGHRITDDSRSSAALPADPRESKPPDFSEVDAVVRRLLGVIGSYLVEGQSSHVGLTPKQILMVIDAVDEHARSDEPHMPQFEPNVEGVFMAGLYEELIQQPSNICEKVSWPDGRTAWMGLTRTFWQRALKLLRETAAKRMPKTKKAITAAQATERLLMARVVGKG